MKDNHDWTLKYHGCDHGWSRDIIIINAKLTTACNTSAGCHFYTHRGNDLNWITLRQFNTFRQLSYYRVQYLRYRVHLRHCFWFHKNIKKFVLKITFFILLIYFTSIIQICFNHLKMLYDFSYFSSLVNII